MRLISGRTVHLPYSPDCRMRQIFAATGTLSIDMYEFHHHTWLSRYPNA